MRVFYFYSFYASIIFIYVYFKNRSTSVIAAKEAVTIDLAQDLRIGVDTEIELGILIKIIGIGKMGKEPIIGAQEKYAEIQSLVLPKYPHQLQH